MKNKQHTIGALLTIPFTLLTLRFVFLPMLLDIYESIPVLYWAVIGNWNDVLLFFGVLLAIIMGFIGFIMVLDAEDR